MKKLIAFALVTLFSWPLLKAQESTFDLNDIVVNLGIGFGSSYGYGLYSSILVSGKNNIPEVLSVIRLIINIC